MLRSEYSNTNTRLMHIISNEHKVGSVIQGLRTKKFSTNHSNSRYALIVGEGSFTSMLPEVSALCDGVILADINPLINQHNQLIISLLLQSKDREEFKSLYTKNAGRYVYYMLEEHEKRGELGRIGFEKLFLRAKELNENFFLHSDKRFSDCKKAASQINIQFLRINLFRLKEVENLKKMLASQEASVTLINVSNLYEWDADKNVLNCTQKSDWVPHHNVANMLKCLLDSTSDYIILYSSYDKNDDSLLIAKMEISIENYLKAAEQAIQIQILIYADSCKSLDKRM